MLARKLYKDHINIEWTAREVCWTLVKGKLKLFDDNTSLNEITKIADIIIKHSPDNIAKKIAVFAVLKNAKKKDDWNVIDSWVDLLDVDSLSTVPMTLTDGKKAWSDKCIWYNYKIKSLLKRQKYEKAKEKAITAETICPDQWLFFLRLKAHALKNLGDMKAAKEIYRKLCGKKYPEWWLLHEYGNICQKDNDHDKAIKCLCDAALAKGKLDMMLKRKEIHGRPLK